MHLGRIGQASGLRCGIRVGAEAAGVGYHPIAGGRMMRHRCDNGRAMGPRCQFHPEGPPTWMRTASKAGIRTVLVRGRR
jgi:hypothetical protein